MAFTQSEAANFHYKGREILTEIAKAVDDAAAYRRTFEARGGALAMGDPYGAETEVMIEFLNNLRDFMAGPNGSGWNQTQVDKNRTDL